MIFIVLRGDFPDTECSLERTVMAEMYVLGISTSPRAGGNTDLLLDECLRGVSGEGVRAEKVKLSEYRILPCTQCDSCQRSGRCVIEDDMRGLYEKIAAADALVFASPIYFMAHCAQAKLLIDRCQAFWSKRYVLKERVRDGGRPWGKGVFISTGGSRGMKIFDGAKMTMKWFFDAIEMEYWGELLFDRVDEKGAVREHPTALREAFEMGRRIRETIHHEAHE